MNDKTKLILQKIGLAVGTIIVLIVLAEIAGLWYVHKYSLDTAEAGITQYSGYRLFKYGPHITINTPFNGVNLKTDSYGLVSSQDRIYNSVHPGIYRILVFGGSTIEGRGVSTGTKTIPAVLESKLNQKYPGRKFEVLNMGVPGYTSMQEFLYLKETADRFAPDMVIFMDGFNDMRERYFGATSVFADMASRPDFSMRLAELEGSLNSPPSLINPDYLTAHSNFFTALFSGLERLSHLSQKSNSCGLTSDNLQAAADLGSQNNLENLELSREIASEHGAVFMGFLQPIITDKSSLTANEKEYEARLAPLSAGIGNKWCIVENKDIFFEFMENFFMETANKGKSALGSQYADLSGLFRDDTEELFADGVHYNDNGDAIIADKIISDIASKIK